jgi:hypothetical protein
MIPTENGFNIVASDIMVSLHIGSKDMTTDADEFDIFRKNTFRFHSRVDHSQEYGNISNTEMRFVFNKVFVVKISPTSTSQVIVQMGIHSLALKQCN